MGQGHTYPAVFCGLPPRFPQENGREPTVKAPQPVSSDSEDGGQVAKRRAASAASPTGTAALPKTHSAPKSRRKLPASKPGTRGDSQGSLPMQIRDGWESRGRGTTLPTVPIHRIRFARYNAAVCIPAIGVALDGASFSARWYRCTRTSPSRTATTTLGPLQARFRSHHCC